jgi:RNA polymerase sigma factor (sigma-70 family)
MADTHGPDREALVRDHVTLARLYAARWAGSHRYALWWGQAADLQQESYEALCRAAVHFDPGRGAKFSTYLWMAVRTHLCSLTRRHHQFTNLPDAALERPAPEPAPDWSEEVALLRRALPLLPQAERRVLETAYGLGDRRPLTCRAQAERAGVSHARVCQLRRAARGRLRSLLVRCADGVRGY